MKFKRVYIEISNICNLQCSFCPEVERTKKVMSADDFASYIPQIAPLTEEICLHLMGEPTAHPEFATIVDLCSKFKVPVNLTTNGTLLGKKGNAELLLHPIFRQVNFSVQSFFGNPQLQTLADYLAPIFSWTKQAMEKRPDLYVNYRLWTAGTPEDDSQKSQILALVEKEFSVEINPNVDVGFKKSKRVAGRLYLHFDSRFEWPSVTAKDPSITPMTQGTCHGLRSHIGIHADGSVVPCCLDKEAQLILGDLKSEGLSDILSSPRAKNIREGFERGELRESLCRTCTFIRRF